MRDTHVMSEEWLELHNIWGLNIVCLIFMHGSLARNYTHICMHIDIDVWKGKLRKAIQESYINLGSCTKKQKNILLIAVLIVVSCTKKGKNLADCFVKEICLWKCFTVLVFMYLKSFMWFYFQVLIRLPQPCRFTTLVVLKRSQVHELNFILELIPLLQKTSRLHHSFTHRDLLQSSLHTSSKIMFIIIYLLKRLEIWGSTCTALFVCSSNPCLS